MRSPTGISCRPFHGESADSFTFSKKVKSKIFRTWFYTNENLTFAMYIHCKSYSRFLRNREFKISWQFALILTLFLCVKSTHKKKTWQSIYFVRSSSLDFLQNLDGRKSADSLRRFSPLHFSITARKSAHFFPEKRCPKKGYWTWQLAQRPMTTLGGVVVPPQ